MRTLLRFFLDVVGALLGLMGFRKLEGKFYLAAYKLYYLGR